jgi:hypothetical protein
MHEIHLTHPAAVITAIEDVLAAIASKSKLPTR